MKQILLIIGILAGLMVPAVLIEAQTSETCGGVEIASRVEEAYATFHENAESSLNLESSLASIEAFLDAMNRLYDACDEVRYQAYVDAGTALLEDLREGGYVIYVRHAKTDSSQSDTDLSSCETQRNLSEEGRADASLVGAAWSTLDIQVDLVISTEYCRTRETAEMVFGEPTVIPKEELETTLDELLAEPPAEGTNTVIVGHVDLLEDVTGIQIPEDTAFNEGDALVYRPLGGAMGAGGYELVMRISLSNWFDLERIAREMN